MNLDELGQKYTTDKASTYPLFAQPGWGGKGQNYCHIYQRWFDPHWRESADKLLELGVMSGASLRMWVDYFTKAHIYGYDVGPCDFEHERVTKFLGRQEIRQHLDILRPHAPFDIIIDDCGHSFLGQQISLGHLFPMLKPGGLYIIEDLFTSHVGQHRNNPEVPGLTTLRLMRELVNGQISRSQYMTDAEIAYVNAHTLKATIELGDRSEIAFIQKRADVPEQAEATH